MTKIIYNSLRPFTKNETLSAFLSDLGSRGIVYWSDRYPPTQEMAKKLKLPYADEGNQDYYRDQTELLLVLFGGAYCAFEIHEDFGNLFRCLKPVEDFEKYHVFEKASASSLYEFLWRSALHCLCGESPGYLYLLESSGYYKIGITKDIDSRYQRYITENPNENNLIFAIRINNYAVIEKGIKKLYSKKNHRGEWFVFDENDIVLLLKIAESFRFSSHSDSLQNVYNYSAELWPFGDDETSSLPRRHAEEYARRHEENSKQYKYKLKTGARVFYWG